jgi:hypothetical protein
MQQDSSIGDMILLVNRKCIDACLIESRSDVLIPTEMKAQWETEIATMQDTIAQAIVARDERRAAKDALEAPSVGRKKHRARVDAALRAAETQSRHEMSKVLKHPSLITEARAMAMDSRDAAMERAKALSKAKADAAAALATAEKLAAPEEEAVPAQEIEYDSAAYYEAQHDKNVRDWNEKYAEIKDLDVNLPDFMQLQAKLNNELDVLDKEIEDFNRPRKEEQARAAAAAAAAAEAAAAEAAQRELEAGVERLIARYKQKNEYEQKAREWMRTAHAEKDPIAIFMAAARAVMWFEQCEKLFPRNAEVKTQLKEAQMLHDETERDIDEYDFV